MNPVDVVAALAVIQFLVTCGMVGRARVRHAVHAPSTAGHPQFERAYRVQMNTLEQLVAFLPALLLAQRYWPGTTVALIGTVYLVGRALYARAYLRDPARRGPGFLLTVLPTAVLLILVLIGAMTGR